MKLLGLLEINCGKVYSITYLKFKDDKNTSKRTPEFLRFYNYLTENMVSNRVQQLLN